MKKVKVYTKDNMRLADAHSARVRELLKNDKGVMLTKDDEKVLFLNKTSEEIKGIS